MFLYAHYLCPPTQLLFFIIPVNKVWYALFYPKVHPVVTGNWCTTNATSKPPKHLHRTTGSYTGDYHASQHGHFLSRNLYFELFALWGFFPFTLAFHNIINRLPQMLAAEKLFIIFTWEINFSVGHFFCILCILSAVFLCYSY